MYTDGPFRLRKATERVPSPPKARLGLKAFPRPVKRFAGADAATTARSARRPNLLYRIDKSPKGKLPSSQARKTLLPSVATEGARELVNGVLETLAAAPGPKLPPKSVDRARKISDRKEPPLQATKTPPALSAATLGESGGPTFSERFTAGQNVWPSSVDRRNQTAEEACQATKTPPRSFAASAGAVEARIPANRFSGALNLEAPAPAHEAWGG